jgi:hypothetical protein
VINGVIIDSDKLRLPDCVPETLEEYDDVTENVCEGERDVE